MGPQQSRCHANMPGPSMRSIWMQPPTYLPTYKPSCQGKHSSIVHQQVPTPLGRWSSRLQFHTQCLSALLARPLPCCRPPAAQHVHTMRQGRYGGLPRRAGLPSQTAPFKVLHLIERWTWCLGAGLPSRTAPFQGYHHRWLRTPQQDTRC
jgi:hypothetical protein